MAFQSISRDFFIGWRGEQDLSLLRVNFAHGALAEGGAPYMESDSSACCPVGALPQPVPQHNLWRAVRFAGTDRLGVDPILDDGGAVGAGRFFESGVAGFFCNVLGLMYLAPNEILVFKIQAGHHLGGRAKPKCAAMHASSIAMAFASSICPPFRW